MAKLSAFGATELARIWRREPWLDDIESIRMLSYRQTPGGKVRVYWKVKVLAPGYKGWSPWKLRGVCRSVAEAQEIICHLLTEKGWERDT